MQPKVDKYLVVVAGPTAVGKTQTALALALQFGSVPTSPTRSRFGRARPGRQAVIVSADSRQIFREMDIGTAKPTTEEQRSVPHYFIDHLSIAEPYSAGKYAHECTALLEQLFTRHKVIFLVGGAGLYIRAVIEGFDNMPHVPLAARQKWENIFETEGIAILQEAIKKQDPSFAEIVDLKNPRRLVRALSLMETAGMSVTALRQQARDNLPYSVLKIFCNLPREELYGRIHARVDTMIESGLVDEVRSLLPYRDTQAMQTVGYKEIVAYLDGSCTLDDAIAKIKQHSCNYAKRQLTWFRNQGDWMEFNPPEVDKIVAYIIERAR